MNRITISQILMYPHTQRKHQDDGESSVLYIHDYIAKINKIQTILDQHKLHMSTYGLRKKNKPTCVYNTPQSQFLMLRTTCTFEQIFQTETGVRKDKKKITTAKQPKSEYLKLFLLITRSLLDT